MIRSFSFRFVALLASTLLYGQQPHTATTQDNPAQPTAVAGPAIQGYNPVEILSDTMGVNFATYLRGVIIKVKRNWYLLVPPEALPPSLKQGTVAIEFSIHKDDNIEEVRYSAQSGRVAMDRAAYGAITSSVPFDALPVEFKGEFLRVRFTFVYNPPRDIANATSGNGAAVRLSEILVSTQKIAAGDEQKLGAARAKAVDLLAKIRAGADFEDLAKQNSEDRSGTVGGDLGLFRRGVLAKSVEDLVFGLKLGDVTDVIRTKQGFIILKVTEHLSVATLVDKPAPAGPK